MASKLLSALVAGALMTSSSAAFAAPAPVRAAAPTNEASALGGITAGAGVGITFALIVFVLAIWSDELFNDEGATKSP